MVYTKIFHKKLTKINFKKIEAKKIGKLRPISASELEQIPHHPNSKK
jgi:hypothetical protein